VNGTAQSLTANGGTIGWGGNVSEAFSSESIPGDGYVESTINSNPVLSRNVGVGLSYADVAGHPLLSIDYCLWQAWSGQKFIVYVNGAAVYTVPGSFAAGDVARVERVGSTIHFKVNGVSVFDTTEFSSGALHADMTINRTGHLITGLTLMTGPPQRVADVRSYSDYYPYGWAMVGRNANLTDYRFGMNGMEMDNAHKGDGASYTSFFRQYDPRVGRWMSIDPVTHPWQSPYNAFDANPLYYADPSGADGKGGTVVNNSTSGNYIQDQGGGRSFVASDGLTYSLAGSGYKDSNWGNASGAIELGMADVSAEAATSSSGGLMAGLKSAVGGLIEGAGEVVAHSTVFTVGVANSVGSNHLLGAGRGNPEDFGKYSRSARVGQTVGDGLSLLAGAMEFLGGAALAAGGGVVTVGTGGAAAPVSVPATAAGVGVSGVGVTVIKTATDNLIESLTKSRAKDNMGGKSSGGGNYKKLSKNSDADAYARSKGYKDAHDLKESHDVGSEFDIFVDQKTKEGVLRNKSQTVEIPIY